MSYDESDNDGEWEVVDIVQTTTSVNPTKPKAAKKEDVDKLAAEMQSQLSLTSTQLEEKMRRQERLSQQQLADIQSKLSAITRIQSLQERQQHDLDKQRQQLEAQQKQAMLEQQIKIESLSELTQKQIAEAQQKIKLTQQATLNVTENVQTLQQIQQHQASQHQQQLQEQAQQLQSQQMAQTQQQLTQLAQIQQMAQQQVQPTFIPPPPLQQPTMPAMPQYTSHPQGHPMSNGVESHSNPNPNGNGWLPSFFVFGNKSNASSHPNAVNTQSADMDISSPNISTTITTSFEQIGNVQPPLHPIKSPLAPPMQHAAEEKANILDEDDDEVLGWNNEYGASAAHRSLSGNPGLLKTKGVIGEGTFRPNEQRQCGWVLQNKSRAVMKLHARLECIGGAEDGRGIRVSAEKEYEFLLKPEEEVFILIEVEAPSIVGKYCAWYRLVTDNGVKVGETLEVMCEVEAQFNKSKEDKIASLIKMGFDDRKKVVATLQKKKWNVQQSVDALIST